MAITSVGYDGTVDEVQWASMVSKVGGYEYGVDGAGDFSVSQIAGTRMISIASGTAWGRGVMDISDAAVNLQLDAVSTGARWDMIALRRTWGPSNGGPTELVVVKGTSAKQLPAGRLVNPGFGDDQPIALVRVQAGVTSIPEVVDLRVWGRNGGQLYAKDDLVRSYLNAVGTEVNVAGIQWQRVVGSNGVAEWKNRGPLDDTFWSHAGVQNVAGWKTGYMRHRVKNGMTQLLVVFERTGGTLTPPPNGDLANILVSVAPPAIAPRVWWAPLASGPSGRMATGSIEQGTGRIHLAATTSHPIYQGDLFSLCGFYFTD